MKLEFKKNESEEVIVETDGEVFVSQSYIKMIKNLHKGTKVKVAFDDKFTPEEKDSVNAMIKKINNIEIEKGVVRKIASKKPTEMVPTKKGIKK